MTEDLRAIHVDEYLAHPPARVWRALTDPDLLATWLMRNDFRRVVGHRLRRFQLGPWDVADARAGLHPAVMQYLADRKIALLGSVEGVLAARPTIASDTPRA